MKAEVTVLSNKKLKIATSFPIYRIRLTPKKSKRHRLLGSQVLGCRSLKLTDPLKSQPD